MYWQSMEQLQRAHGSQSIPPEHTAKVDMITPRQERVVDAKLLSIVRQVIGQRQACRTNSMYVSKLSVSKFVSKFMS